MESFAYTTVLNYLGVRKRLYMLGVLIIKLVNPTATNFPFVFPHMGM